MTTKHTFRCAECQKVMVRATHPGVCPRCGGADLEVKLEDGTYAPA